MHKNLRIRYLSKLAQQTTSVSGSPPSFIASDLSNTISKGYNSSILDQINKLSFYLNNILYYTSNGKYNFPQLYKMAFTIDTSGIGDQDLKKIVEFCKQIYILLYNGNSNFVDLLVTEEIHRRIGLLDNNTNLNSLSNVNPSGQLATKAQGNIKKIE